MLIKDYYGDWGILIAKWEGFKKGVPGTAGKYYYHSESGSAHYKMYVRHWANH
jgi:hypothetical protein